MADTYKINKGLQLNTVNEGEPTDNVLVQGIDNEVKFVPRSEFSGGSQDITLDKAAEAGSTLTNKEVVFTDTENTIKTTITKDGITVLENAVTDMSTSEIKTLIDKQSISISEKISYEEYGEDHEPQEGDIVIDGKKSEVFIDKNNIGIFQETIINPEVSEFNSIGIDASELNLYAQQGSHGFRANPFSFGFTEGYHNVSFMLSSSIAETRQIRFNPLGGTVTYEDSFKTINGQNIVGSGNIVIGGSSATPNLQDVLNTGRISTTTGQNNHFQLRSQFYDGGPYHDMIFKRNSIRAEFDGGGYVFDENGIYSIANLYSGGIGSQGFSLTSGGGLNLKTNPIGAVAIIKSDELVMNTIFQLPGYIDASGPITLAAKRDIETYVSSRTVYSTTTTSLTSADLNTAYPTATAGFRVIAQNIPSDKAIYEKTITGWIKTAVTIP